MKIDAGKNNTNLKTGLLKYLIPVKIVGNQSAEALNNSNALEHLGDTLTKNFWDKYGEKFPNLSADEEKKYLINL